MSITFGNICDLLEGVEKVCIRRPRLPPEREKTRTRTVITDWFSFHRKAIDDPCTNGGAILSILFPHRRKDRVYGMKGTLLAKKLTKLLNFNHGQSALFAGWRSGPHGDLGAYTERAMRPWRGTFKEKPTITVERIDRLLVQLAANNRFSDPAIREQKLREFKADTELQHILIRLDCIDAKWLVRLLLREYSTMELDESFVLRSYHFLLPDLLQFQNDFDAVFEMLRGELSCFPAVPAPNLENSLRIDASKQLKAVVGTKVGRPAFYKAWSFRHCLQMTSDRAWAADVKYDGEYCEIHVDIDASPNDIRIFSKNGKDATSDRRAVHDSIRTALRLGKPDCIFEKRCIVLGELVLYSDKKEDILPFSKIRKRISRSGHFIGTLQDSIPHEWEHLMIVFFDLLLLDDEHIMRKSLQERRDHLRELIQPIPGRAIRAEWTLVDFNTELGVTDLKMAFARSLARRQEGLLLKPLHASYFPLLSEIGDHQPGFFIKLKQDYLADMGGERDLGDFAIIGARFDPQAAGKSDLKPLHWTHFYLGCLTNKTAVQRTETKPKFKIVGCLSLYKAIPKSELKYLNVYGRLCQVDLHEDSKAPTFDIEQPNSYGPRMSVAFKKPFVAEVLGGGYETLQNESFEMLRHPRVKKIHHDRGWEDTVSMEDLERMAKEKWDIPDANRLDGHAKDVALLAKKYTEELYGSEAVTSETSQETTQHTSPHETPETPQKAAQYSPNDETVQETQEISTPGTCTTTSTIQCPSSTQGIGLRASKRLRILVREDTSERERLSPELLSSPPSSTHVPTSSRTKRTPGSMIVSPPPLKRRKLRTPLIDAGGNKSLGSFENDSQEKTIQIYAEAGWKVQVHNG